MQATMMEATGSGVGCGNGTALVIDDHGPVSEGKFVAAARLIAFLGSGDHFAGADPRSAWQWVVRLPDGTHRTLTFLVNHNRRPIHVFAAALSGDESLLGKDAHCDAHQLIGRSAMVEVKHQECGEGRTRPYVATAWKLPADVKPIVLSDACVWTPAGGSPLPRYAPQWVRDYANVAISLHQQRKAATPTE